MNLLYQLKSQVKMVPGFTLNVVTMIPNLKKIGKEIIEYCVKEKSVFHVSMKLVRKFRFQKVVF